MSPRSIPQLLGSTYTHAFPLPWWWEVTSVQTPDLLYICSQQRTNTPHHTCNPFDRSEDPTNHTSQLIHQAQLYLDHPFRHGGSSSFACCGRKRQCLQPLFCLPVDHCFVSEPQLIRGQLQMRGRFDFPRTKPAEDTTSQPAAQGLGAANSWIWGSTATIGGNSIGGTFGGTTRGMPTPMF